MIIGYVITYLIAFGSCGYFVYNFAKGDMPAVKDKDGKLKKLINEDLFSIFGGLKNRFANKKSVFLIKLAQAGFIRIRKDDAGKIYIDKLRDFDSLGENIQSVISEVFSDNVSFYGDENAIMSYETVSWDDAKKRYRKRIDDILQGFKSEQKEKEVVKKTKFSSLKSKLFTMWLIGLLPLSISYAFADGAYNFDEYSVQMFSLYAMSFIEYIVFVVEYKGIKGLWGYLKQTKDMPMAIKWIVKGFGYFFLFALAVFVIMGIFFAAATVAICEEIFDFPLNVILAIVLVLISIYALLVNYKTKKEFSDESIYDSLLNKRNIKKAIQTKEDYEKAVTYAYMFDKMKALEAAKQEEELCPEWYEGNDWQNEEELMLQLDAK